MANILCNLSPRLLAGPVVLLFAWLVYVGIPHKAAAQSDTPTALEPQSLEAVTGDGTSGGSEGITVEGVGESETWSSPTTPSAVLGAGDSSIEVNVLDSLGADMAGTLNPDNGGFQPDLWLGTPRDTVDRLMSIMPVHVVSPAMRGLMRRILLTQAIPPEGGVDDGEFIARRLELLAAMGDVDSVEALLAITPGRETTERLFRIETDLHLVHGDFVKACAIADGPAKENLEDYWEKLRIFCEVLSGAHAQAQLGLSLLREIGVEDKAYYLMLDSMMASEVPALDDLSDLGPLHIGIIRASRARLNPAEVVPLPPAILSTISGNPDMDMEIRLMAAEKAAGTGILPIEALQELYRSVDFEASALSNPLSTAETLSGSKVRALMYQVVSRQTVDGARAEAALQALESAVNADLYAITAQVFNNDIRQVPPRTDLIWFAAHAVRALAIAGDSEATANWLSLLRGSAPLSEEASLALAQLAPVVQLAGLGEENLFARTSGTDLWRKAHEVTSGNRQKAVLYYSLLESLGRPVAPPLWDELGYGVQSDAMRPEEKIQPAGGVNDLPDPVLWHRLSGAARAGKTGETVLLALATLGPRGTADANPVTVSHVVQSFALIGMEAEARALAVEAALAGGL